MKNILMLLLGMGLAGCASNSGVVPMGQDTFMVSRQAATGFSGSGNLKAEALQEANQFCINQGRMLKVTRAWEASPPYIMANFPKAEIQFMCLDAREAKKFSQKNDSDNNRSVSTELQSSGTGFFITEDGYILTASHVVSDAHKIEVVTFDKKLIIASVVTFDPNNDIAVLKAETKSAALPLATSGEIQPGDKVATIGFPNIDIQGKKPKYTDGSVNSLSGIQDDPRVFQISIPVQSGNSGGPLFDSNGNVIGIVIKKLSAQFMLRYTGNIPENVNYAIKSAYVFPLIENHREIMSALKGKKSERSTYSELENSVVLIYVY